MSSDEINNKKAITTDCLRKVIYLFKTSEFGLRVDLFPNLIDSQVNIKGFKRPLPFLVVF